LHQRLVAFGDLPQQTLPPGSTVYQGELVAAVKQFQLRHGLEPDGVIGRATLAALRVPLDWRVRQIELSLERLRWLPDLSESRLIAINIPMFRLWSWDPTLPFGAPVFETNVIVGRALDTETPVFVEELRHVILRPYWNVPRSILRHEIIPHLDRNPDYLRQQQMELVSGPGDDARTVPVTRETIALLKDGRLRVRQRPGPRNALGLVKFVFPNDENIYMHGTPAQDLFSRSRRDFSHGCIRVEDPVALAEWVMSEEPGWNRDRILTAMSAGPSCRITLTRPIQVVLFYLTAVVTADGSIHFAEDIYGHDHRLARALGRQRTAS
jgi:murein L,D-transpeptidase YcbB/YkuD